VSDCGAPTPRATQSSLGLQAPSQHHRSGRIVRFIASYTCFSFTPSFILGSAFQIRNEDTVVILRGVSMESLVRPSNNLIQCIFLIVQFYSIDMVRLGGDFCVVVVVVVDDFSQNELHPKILEVW